MANTAFNILFGLVPELDTSKLNTDIEKISASFRMAGKDINFRGMEFAGLDTGALKESIDRLNKSKRDVLSVSGEIIQKYDAEGNAYKHLTSAVIRYRTETGKVFKVQETYVDKLATSAEQLNAFNSVNEKAEKYALRASQMSGKQGKALGDASLKVKNAVKEWQEYVKTGKVTNEGIKEKTDNINRLTKEMELANERTKRSAVGLQNWTNTITRAIKQTIAYSFSLGLVRKAQQLLREAIQFNIELNKEMTKIQVLQAKGAQTPDEITALARSYNELAKSLGATTMEIAEGSVEWLRQGKTVEETAELMKSSMMLSKLGAVEAAEATEFLTSTLNGFEMEAEDAISVVDKLVQVDNIAATSTRELATALRYVAAVANQSGVTFEQLVSYIAVLSETTRLNAEQIGQSLKTIFTRMQDIQAGGLDEEGMNLNNVEKALARVDIKLRDSETSFRDLSDVLEDVAGKWSSLNEIEQANIAKAIAGVRQQNMFRILMQEMSTAIEYQEEQYNALGVATDRYGIYLDSIAGKQAEFKATLEGLIMEDGFQDLIKDIIELGTKVLELIDNFGGFRNIILLLAMAFVALNITKIITFFKDMGFAISAVITKTATLTEVTIAYKTVTQGLAGIAVASFMLIASAIAKAIKTQKELLESLEEMGDKISKSLNKYEDLKKSVINVKRLKQEMAELQNKTKLTTDDTQRLTEIYNELHDIFPNMAVEYDIYGNAIITSNSNLEQSIFLLEEELSIQKNITLETIKQNALEADSIAIKSKALLITQKERLSSVQSDIKATEDQIATWEQDIQDLIDNTPDSTERQNAIIAINNEIMAYEFSLSNLQSEEEKLTSDIAQGELNLIKARQLALNVYSQLQTEEERNAWEANIGLKESIDDIANYRVKKAEESRMAIAKLEREAEIEREGYSFAKPVIEAKEVFEEILPTIQNGVEEFSSVLESLSNNPILPEDTPDKLKAIKMELQYATDGAKEFYYVSESGNRTLIASTKDYIDAVIAEIKEFENLSPELENIIREKLELASTTNDGIDVMDDYSKAVSTLGDAYKEQEENGKLSLETISKLIDAGYANALVYDKATDSYRLDEYALRQLISQKMMAISVSYQEQAQIREEQGLLDEETKKLYDNAEAWAIRSEAMAGGNIDIPTFFGGGVSSGGGGGGGTEENPEIEALEEQIELHEEEKEAIEKKIDALEDEIDVLEDRKDAYADYIDTLKEALELEKEESDYQDEIGEKNKDLSKLKKELALLEMDTSEEAAARRLELEEEIAEAETDIRKTQEDRRYELQVQALEKMQENFEIMIDKQIEAIEKVIEAYERQMEAIDEIIEGIQEMIEALREADSVGGSTYISDDNPEPPPPFRPNKWGTRDSEVRLRVHSGGLIEEHHNGDFAGNLRSNEVFAKLLKGEYVSTEGQMKNFMTNILPKIATMMPVNVQQRAQSEDISVSIPITVQGNMDSSTIPQIDAIANRVVEKINKAIVTRGHIRTTNQTVI